MVVTIGHVDLELDVILRDRRTGKEYEAGTITHTMPVRLDYVPASGSGHND